MHFPSNHQSRITIHGFLQGLIGSVVLALGLTAVAAAEPYGFGDIRLGASFDTLAHSLDFRDFHAALDRQLAAKAAKPDLGQRGYGCIRREDPRADIACVSHDEMAGGAPTREIRLHFLDGVLQQFSITAEISEFETLLAELRQQYGAPNEIRPATGDGFASRHWRNADSTLSIYRGKDLVFVSFELKSYAEAVARRQRGVTKAPP